MACPKKEYSLGSVEAYGAASRFSPQELQEVLSPPSTRLPRNNAAFALDLFTRNPVELFWETELLKSDFARAGIECLDLITSPIFKGEGLPRGEGSMVIGPGFLMPALAYEVPRRVFSTLGYDVHVYKPQWGTNIVPIEQQIEHFVDFIDKIPGKIIFLGHSKSGLLGLAIYALLRDYFLDKFSQFVSLGAPRPKEVSFGIGIGYLGTQLVCRGDDFQFADRTFSQVDIHNIDGVFLTSIGAKNDRVITKGDLIGHTEEQAEFESSHSGLLFNKNVVSFTANRINKVRSIDSETA